MNNILSKKPYCQKIQKNDQVDIQIKSDYTTITAWLYNLETKSITSLSPSVDTVYTSFSFWKIPIIFDTNGYFKLFIHAESTGFTTLDFVSEMIEVRDTWENIKIYAYNLDNTGYVDYSTGLRHTFRVFGIIRFSDIGGKEEFYNNFGVEERVYAENETIYELSIEDIPYYLCRQLLYCGKLDIFNVNDVDFIMKDHSITPHSGSYNYDLLLKLTQKEVAGVSEFILSAGMVTADVTTITTDNG
jgi:hypothetical protein